MLVKVLSIEPAKTLNQSYAVMNISVGDTNNYTGKINVEKDNVYNIDSTLKTLGTIITLDYSEVFEQFSIWQLELNQKLVAKNISDYNNHPMVIYYNANKGNPDLAISKTVADIDATTVVNNITLLYCNVIISYSDKVYKPGAWHASKTDKVYYISGRLTDYKTIRFAKLDSVLSYIDKKLKEKELKAIAANTAVLANETKINNTLAILQTNFPGYVITSKTETKYSNNHWSNRWDNTSYQVTNYYITINGKEINISYNSMDNNISIANLNNITIDKAKQIINILAA